MNKSIPVERASDLAKYGDGTIVFEDNLTIKGTDTKFTSQLNKGDSIKIICKEDARIEDQIIEEIVNDTELVLKKPGAKVYTPDEQYPFKIIPKMDQSGAFREVEKVLGGGGAVAIYPEGGSHD